MDQLTRLRYLLFGFVVFTAIMLWTPAQAAAQDKYITVDAKELVNSPHRYWARAILFKDKLVSLPTERPFRIDKKRYTPFKTKIVGTCYASPTIVDALKKLTVGKAYAFSGSVFQHRGRYYIIVQDVDTTVDAGEMLREMRALAPEIGPEVKEEAVKPIADVVWAVESAHLAYAKEQDIPLCELYDPQSVYYPKAIELVRSAILDKEQKDSTVSSEMLAQYIVLALAKSCANTNLIAAGSPAESVEIYPQTTNPETAMPLTAETTHTNAAEKSKPPPLFIPPQTERPLSFWQRRRKLRAEKLKEKQAQREAKQKLDEEKRLQKEKEKERRIKEKQKKERLRQEAIAKEQLAAQEEQRRIAEEQAEQETKTETELEISEEPAEIQPEVTEQEPIPEKVTQSDIERIAAEEQVQIDAERIAAEQTEQKRLAEEQRVREEEEARQKALAEGQARKEAERIAAEKAEQERLAEEQRLREEEEARQKALAEEQAQKEAERIAAEQAEQERLAEEQRLRAEEEARQKALAEEQAQKEAERIAAEKAERERLAEEQRLREEEEARQKALAEEQAQKEAERIAAEKAEQERLAEEQRVREEEQARIKAEQEQFEREKQARLDAARIAAEQAERKSTEQDVVEKQITEEAPSEAKSISEEEQILIEQEQELSFWQRFKERRRIAAEERAKRRAIEQEEIRKRQAAWAEYFAAQGELEKAAEIEAQESMIEETVQIEEPTETISDDESAEALQPEPETEENIEDKPVVITFDPREMDRLRRIEEKKFREFQTRQRREKARIERDRKIMEREIQRKIEKYSQ